MPTLSETTVVDPPSGALNVPLGQSMVFEHFRIECLPSFGSFTMLETAR
jgi:hypothetical protein